MISNICLSTVSSLLSQKEISLHNCYHNKGEEENSIFNSNKTIMYHHPSEIGRGNTMDTTTTNTILMSSSSSMSTLTMNLRTTSLKEDTNCSNVYYNSNPSEYSNYSNITMKSTVSMTSGMPNRVDQQTRQSDYYYHRSSSTSNPPPRSPTRRSTTTMNKQMLGQEGSQHSNRSASPVYCHRNIIKTPSFDSLKESIDGDNDDDISISNPRLRRPVMTRNRSASGCSTVSASSNATSNSVRSYTSKTGVGDTFNQRQNDKTLLSSSSSSSSSCVLDELKHGKELIVYDLAMLIEKERRRQKLYPLERSPELDYMAREHCRSMALCGQVYHSVTTLSELQLKLSSTRVGENIQRGLTLCDIYRTMMTNPAHAINRSNVLSTKFTEFGSAIYIGETDGKLYCCQFFRRVVY